MTEETQDQEAGKDSEVCAPDYVTPVTCESFLAELMPVVRRDARGISHALESLLEKSEKYFGL